MTFARATVATATSTLALHPLPPLLPPLPLPLPLSLLFVPVLSPPLSPHLLFPFLSSLALSSSSSSLSSPRPTHTPARPPPPPLSTCCSRSFASSSPFADLASARASTLALDACERGAGAVSGSGKTPGGGGYDSRRALLRILLLARPPFPRLPLRSTRTQQRRHPATFRTATAATTTTTTLFVGSLPGSSWSKSTAPENDYGDDDDDDEKYERFVPPSNLCGLFAGSGSDGLSEPCIVNAVLDLVVKDRNGANLHNRNRDGTTITKPPEHVTVLYLGTATYDLPYFKERQTFRFKEMGCTVLSLDVALDDDDPCRDLLLPSAGLVIGPMPPKSIMVQAVNEADVIVVGGGNTLYAVDRWKRLGLDVLLRDAAATKGTVLTGGSAGAICWFDGGHSDSMDPGSYKYAKLETFGKVSFASATSTNKMDSRSRSKSGPGPNSPMELHDETSAAIPLSSSSSSLQRGAGGGDGINTKKPWEYIRVPGLSILPGLICPHYDVIQSNGVLRSDDFDSMMLRHASELGIGIDHWAALEVSGDHFRVLSVEGKERGEVKKDMYSTGSESLDVDAPGVWIKEVTRTNMNGTVRVRTRKCKSKGKVKDLLRYARSGEDYGIVEDDRLERCRQENPSVYSGP